MNRAQNTALKIARFHPRYKSVKPTKWAQVTDDLSDYKKDIRAGWDNATVSVRRAYINAALIAAGMALLEIAIHFSGV